MTLARRLVRKNGYILNINYQKYGGFCMPILLDLWSFWSHFTPIKMLIY